MTNFSSQGVVFYDGGCSFCMRISLHLQKNDTRQKIRWCNISLKEKKKKLPEELQFVDSIVFFDGNKYFTYSQAVLSILERLSGKYRFFALLIRVFPKPLRDFFYKIVAKNRYIFSSTCKIQ